MIEEYLSEIEKCGNNAKMVYDHMQDDESRKIFTLKCQDLLESRGIEPWIKGILSIYDDFRPNLIPEKYRESIVIFGCGDDGRIVAEILKKSGLTPVCFTKTELKEKDLQYIDGIPVKEFSHIKDEEKYYYLISSSRYRHEIYCVLINAKVSSDRIFVPGEKFPSFDRGNQYFDLFSPSDKEVYVDAGTYDGLTVDRFLEWGGCKARKVYAIEPVDEMYRRLTEKYNSDKRVSVIHGAAWKNSNDVLHFTDSGSGTTMGTTGEMSIKAVSIDDICDVPPTYIKMDIEGSEYFAIKGAEKIIKNSKPKLAICVYHKPNDMINLGGLLLKLVPEYRFWLRHYTTDVYETVLYASI